jgi:drug/metabolite transporter (DMT)-like permease
MHAPLLGFLAALLTAFCQSATDLCTKIATRHAEERAILAAQWGAGAALLGVLCAARHPDLVLHPAAGFAALTRPQFLPLLALSGALNLVAYALYVRAYRLADASLVAPLILTTPVLMLVTSPLMTGERIPPLGALGVVLCVFGAGLLGGASNGARLSFLSLAREPGARSMLMTAAIWSVTANLDKLGLRASTPLLWITAVTMVIALGAVVYWAVSPRRAVRLSDLRHALAAGAANGVGNAVQMYALTLLYTPYVIAIKRMSSLLTMLLSGLLLNERASGRLLGALLILFAPQ